jgi:hypothetical protein
MTRSNVTVQEQASTPMLEAASSVRYMVDASGHKTDVVLPFSVWEKLLAWLENLEDRALVQEMLPRLKTGPAQAGALPWAAATERWDEDEI